MGSTVSIQCCCSEDEPPLNYPPTFRSYITSFIKKWGQSSTVGIDSSPENVNNRNRIGTAKIKGKRSKNSGYVLSTNAINQNESIKLKYRYYSPPCAIPGRGKESDAQGDFINKFSPKAKDVEANRGCCTHANNLDKYAASRHVVNDDIQSAEETRLYNFQENNFYCDFKNNDCVSSGKQTSEKGKLFRLKRSPKIKNGLDCIALDKENSAEERDIIGLNQISKNIDMHNSPIIGFSEPLLAKQRGNSVFFSIGSSVKSIDSQQQENNDALSTSITSDKLKVSPEPVDLGTIWTVGNLAVALNDSTNVDRTMKFNKRQDNDGKVFQGKLINRATKISKQISSSQCDCTWSDNFDLLFDSRNPMTLTTSLEFVKSPCGHSPRSFSRRRRIQLERKWKSVILDSS